MTLAARLAPCLAFFESFAGAGCSIGGGGGGKPEMPESGSDTGEGPTGSVSVS